MPLPSPVTVVGGWHVLIDVCRLGHMLTTDVPSKLHGVNVEEEWYPKENQRAFIRRGVEDGQIKK